MIIKGFENDIILEILLKHIFKWEYNVTYFLSQRDFLMIFCKLQMKYS